MRRQLMTLLGFVFTSLTFMVVASPYALSQASKDFEELKQETVDGVQLDCRYYKAKNSKNNSVVILMHNYLADPNKGGWDDLALQLSKEGFHVMKPDFRGHGKSKDVSKRFWDYPFNKSHIAGGNKNTPPRLIEAKSFNKTSYFPYLVNDLAATRTLIDNTPELNSSSIYLIGGQEMSALGMLFLAAEWNRDGVTAMSIAGMNTQPPIVGNYRGFIRARTPMGEPAGKDYAGCVWLTASKTNSISNDKIKNFVSMFGIDRLTNKGDLRSDNHMLFLYGAKDSAGKRDAEMYFEDALVSNGRKSLRIEKLEFNYLRSIPNTELKGAALLGKNDQLKTEDQIMEFLKAMESQRGKIASIPRNNKQPLLIDITAFGIAP